MPTRAKRRLPLALAVITLAAFLGFKLRDDLLYALSSGEPRDLGAAGIAMASGTGSVPLNRYVRLAGLPDRESALVLDTQGSWKFAQFFRVLATKSRFFVQRTADPLPVALADRDVFTGRLVRFKDLSFESSIRQHFSARVTATHFFKPADLRAALASGNAPAVSDVAGDRVTLNPSDGLVISRLHPGEIRIDLPKDRYPTAASARALIDARGGQVVNSSEDPQHHSFVVTFPPATRDPALSALGDLDRRIRIRSARSDFKVRVGDLTATPEGLSIKSATSPAISIPLEEIQAVRTVAPLEIPDDAVLLLEGDRPADHLKTLVIVAFLLAFALVNLLSLRRPA